MVALGKNYLKNLSTLVYTERSRSTQDDTRILILHLKYRLPVIKINYYIKLTLNN